MKKASYDTPLFRDVLGELAAVKMVDCHEHLQRESELPAAEEVHIGRFMIHYANCDLVSAGMPAADMRKVQDAGSGLGPKERWRLLKPWYLKAWNTGYCEGLRIALRDLYGIEDFGDATVEPLTEAMGRLIRPGYTRTVFDRAGIDVAMNNPFGPKLIFNPDYDPDCFVMDMTDAFTSFPIAELVKQSGYEVRNLSDYLRIIDMYFDRDAPCASAFKVGRAYDRILSWDEIQRSDAERVFAELLRSEKTVAPGNRKALEDFVLHYLAGKCGEYALRMKFHTGLQEGNGNTITNSRAGLMCNLFLKFPGTTFDIYHVSYPYEEELTAIAKNFANVTVDFCWMWVINPAAGRRALSDMLDSVPANKIHGFGGDYIFVEGTYGHAVMARREIARVLCEKIKEGRFTEDYACSVGRQLLRGNAMENFGLTERRQAYRERVAREGASGKQG